MSVASLHKYLGLKGNLAVAGSIVLAVQVVDARDLFGRVDLKVVPVFNDHVTGAAWVKSTKIVFDKKPE